MKTSDSGGLVNKEKWEQEIIRLKSEETTEDFSQYVERISSLLKGAVRKRISRERFGILFSGGVDSTLIAFLCKNLGADFTCYSVGFGDSSDLAAAKRVSGELGFHIRYKEYDLKEAERIVSKTCSILKEHSNVVNVGVGMVEVAACELAIKEDVKILFSGLGSEEIFAGYQRHEQAADINQECWKGLVSMRDRDFIRDFLISGEYGITFETPFLDRELIREAMKIPGEYKIRGDVKKCVLREAAVSLGLGRDIAFRPKKAAQYGSNFDKALSKLAKMHRFRYKKDYINSMLR